MIDFNGSITRRTRILEVILWSGAALVTLGVHTGAVAWMLRSDPVVAADSSPPAAIMVEIASAPEAIQTEKDEINPDQKSAEESRPAEEQKQEETPQEQVVEEITPEKVEPVEDEEVKDNTVVLEKAEVQLPPEKPKPKELKEKQKPQKKPKPQNQRAAADSRAARQAQVQARQSDRMAAAQTASGVSSMSPANWQSKLMAHLERHKRALSGVSGRGTAYVRFSIDGGGNVLSASLVRSSGFSELDQETVALVRRSSPVPAPPPGANRIITVPVRFNAN
jgi:protein TonB